jgi:hypothetical protein
MTNSTLTPSMEVGVPGIISGTGVIKDLCRRIAERLSRDCDLRASDAYSGYSAQVTIRIQLTDVYPCEVSADITVGKIDEQLPSARITLRPDVLIAAGGQPNLERPVVTPPEEPVDAPVAAAPPVEPPAPAPAKGRLVELPVEAAQIDLAPDRGPRDPDYYPSRSDQPLPLRQ